MRFREYLTEIEATPRQGIVHFEAMKPIEFLQLAKEIVAQDKKLKNVKTSLKVDGLSARFGKDANGQFFFESGRSGPIQSQKAFSTFTMNKGGSFEMIERALHYDAIYDLLEDSDIWTDLPNSTKVVCEILYNPMAEVIDDKLKFVSIHYDRAKLGKVMTIVPIKVLGEYDIKDLYAKSTANIKIVSADLGTLDLELDIDLDVVNEIDETVLTSLKHKDRELKLEYVTILQSIKNAIAKQVLDIPLMGKDVIGRDVEGLVIELNGKLFKITTPSFKAEKSAERLARNK